MEHLERAKQQQRERQQRYEARKAGTAPPLQTCNSCGKTMKTGCGNGKAASLGLCYACFKKTSVKKADDRQVYIQRRDRTRKDEIWPVGYWSSRAGEGSDSDRSCVMKHDRLRAAIGYAYGGKPRPDEDPASKNAPVFVAWSDGRVTEHVGLSATNSKGLTPDHWSALDAMPDDVEWFLEQIPPEKRHWFDWEQSGNLPTT